ADGTVKVERQTETGYDSVESSLPALITVTAGANEPRYATLKGIMAAKSKPMERPTVADLGLSAEDVKATQEVIGMEAVPEKAAGEILEASDETAAKVADFLKKAKVI
ncbi:MAG TPA: electron transfer flavoprotein subunit alpha, partial [Actinobacteria bacterium]|nr:electron transfer flavoprotein subunit alpha [Actinomycetota bacterium]